MTRALTVLPIISFAVRSSAEVAKKLTPKEKTRNRMVTRFPHYQWIGLRENLQETIDFPIKYGVFL